MPWKNVSVFFFAQSLTSCSPPWLTDIHDKSDYCYTPPSMLWCFSHRGLLGQSFDSLMHHEIVWDLRACMHESATAVFLLPGLKVGGCVNRSKCTLWQDRFRWQLFSDANLHLTPAPVTPAFILYLPMFSFFYPQISHCSHFIFVWNDVTKWQIHPIWLLLVRTFLLKHLMYYYSNEILPKLLLQLSFQPFLHLFHSGIYLRPYFRHAFIHDKTQITQ